MGQFDLSDATAILKEHYQELTESLNNTCPLTAQIESDYENIASDGRRAVHSVHLQRSSGLGARGETDDLPTADAQGYAQGKVPLRMQTGRIALSVRTIEAAGRDETSFIDAIDGEMQGMMNDLTRDRNRQAWGDGTGAIAQCGTTSSSTTLQLASDTTETQILQAYFDGGMKVEVGTAADPDTVAGGLTVSDYDVSNQTLTVSSSVSTTGSHYVHRENSGGTSDGSGDWDDGQKELTGMQLIVSDGSSDPSGGLHGIDSSTYGKWKATVDSNSGTNRAITEALVNKNIFKIERSSGESVDTGWANYGVFQAIDNLLASRRRVNDEVEVRGGFRGIRWTVPTQGPNPSAQSRVILLDFDCPENSLYLISTNALKRYVTNELKWFDDGAVLRHNSDKPIVEGWCYCIEELATTKRNAHGVIKDITHG